MCSHRQLGLYELAAHAFHMCVGVEGLDEVEGMRTRVVTMLDGGADSARAVEIMAQRSWRQWRARVHPMCKEEVRDT